MRYLPFVISCYIYVQRCEYFARPAKKCNYVILCKITFILISQKLLGQKLSLKYIFVEKFWLK